jgi:hypothetical protein
MDVLEVYERIPTARYCSGCHACAIRCSGGVPASDVEWRRVRDYLRHEMSPIDVARLLHEDKSHTIGDGWAIEFCPLYDTRRRRCAVYPVRPLVCRLLGFVEWMPCPIERRLPILADGVLLMREYAAETLRTLPEWLEHNPLTWDRHPFDHSDEPHFEVEAANG